MQPVNQTARVTVVALLAGAFLTVTTSSAASSVAVTHRTGTIAFIRLIQGPVFGGRLFVIRPDGSGLRRVTPLGTSVYSYAWSPDGRVIAYIDRRRSLWLVRPDGTGRRLLLPSSRLSSTSMSWSPDGKRIAIASPGAGVMSARCPTTPYVVPVDGGQPLSLDAKAGCDVAWSPRGDEIAYDGGGGGISVIRPDGTGRRQILSSGGEPQWSADGSQLAIKVAIHLKHGGTDRYRAFATVGADGKHFHVVTTHAYNEYGVAWSPQGRRILYGRASSPSSYRFHSQGIYVIGPDSRNNHRVTRDSPPQAGWGALAWSPTGGSIVYDTGTDKNTDLYVIGIDGRDKVRLTNTPDFDIDPSWVAR